MKFSLPRAGSALSLACLAAALYGCSFAPPRAPVETRSVINPDRADRGNPPYYEVFGRRYYVLDESEGYRENGIASWYGRDFQGRTTSSGEVYDMNKLTAAHKTLPIPTWVEVTNLANGRRVIVKVNDRGPFVDGRIIDLSQRAAEELDMIGTGTARVRIRALGAPAAAPPAPILAASPAEPQTGAEEEARGGGFSIIGEARADTVVPADRAFRPLYVQVGAFADGGNAAKLVDRLKGEGFDNSFVLTSGQGSKRLHRVRIGPIRDVGQFDRILARLRAAGVDDARLIRDN